jgi:hypothetical protein
MKKAFIITALLLVSVSLPFFAGETKYPYQEAEISYRNVTVYKVFDQKDAYIVMYAKVPTGVGQVTIPKTWYKTGEQKLTFRPLPKGMDPYMTIITRSGTFERVILTMPVSRMSSAWAVAEPNAPSGDLEKTKLDIQY